MTHSMQRMGIFLFFCVLFLIPTSSHAEVIDLDQDGVPDGEDQEVVVTSSQSLPAGEYFFHTLTIVNGSVLTLLGDPNASGDFKGVKITAENITVESGSSLSANGTGYVSNEASLGRGGYNGGYGYGGEGSTKTFTLTVEYDPESTGSYKVQLYSVNFAVDTNAAPTTAQLALPAEDFDTASLTI